jgi:PhnB protein
MDARPTRYRNAVVPHIYVDGASSGIDFYKQAFGAVELFRIADPNGKILHAEISIDGSVVMIGDPDDKLYGEPRKLGRTSASLHIFVDDNEAVLRGRSRLAQNKSSPPQKCFTGRTPPVCATRLGMSGFSSHGRRTSIRLKWSGAAMRSFASRAQANLGNS